MKANDIPSLSYAEQLFANLDASGNYTSDLGNADLNILPVGVKQKVGNNEFSIAISSVVFGTTHAEITIFARLTVPQGNKTLFFAAQGIELSYGGNIVGDASLVLLDDIDIPVGGGSKFTIKGGFDIETGMGTDLTYVSIDCNGFKELSVTGEFEIHKSIATTVDNNGTSTGQPVRTVIKTVVNDWNDFMVGITLPRFQITGLNGFVFQVENAIFDFSDFHNAPGSPIESESPLWRGVYAENLSITMPKEFSKENQKPTSFASRNLLIGSNGITGDFLGENLLSINEGNASGWAFSLDYFRLKIEENTITKTHFEGILRLPVSENTPLKYEGHIDAENRYVLQVENTDSLYFDPFFGRAVIAPNSYVRLLVDNGKFKPEALLHGHMDIKTSITNESPSDSRLSSADFERIEFRDFHIMTHSPYLEIGYLGYEGEIQILKFPVSVSRIALETKNQTACLGFNINLNLDERFLSGTTRLEIRSKYEETNGRGRWKFDRINLTEVAVKGDIAGIMSLKGSVMLMENHPLYGDGFSGGLSLEFKKILSQASIEVNAAFGKKDGYRYWFADGLAGFPGVGIPVIPPFCISGFGGGASYNMKRTASGGLGSSKTGCGYVPDESSGLGLKAAVKFNLAKNNVMNGDASFEMIFNDHGGVNFIGFLGYAKFLEPPSFIQRIEDLYKTYVAYEENSSSSAEELKRIKQTDPETAAKTLTPAIQSISGASFAACMAIQYHFDAHALDANFETYLDAAGGLIRGAGQGNSLGRTSFHISPNAWHLLIGTPDNPIGIELGIPFLLSAATRSYFMMGTDIPGSPPPPKEIAYALKTEVHSLDYMRNLNELSSGTGFAFGTKLGFDTKNLRCLALYARFMAEVGCDLMMKDYGNARCSGRNEPLGINGWYANGQAYAVLMGKVGIKINLGFIKSDFTLLSGTVAALLQAQLPNPAWFRGNLGLNVEAIGGLVKGNMKFRFTLGDQCDIVIEGGSPLDYTIISGLTPQNGSTEVDVFTSPQLALSIPVNQSFFAEEDGKEKEFRMSLVDFSVWKGSSAIEGKVEFNQDNDVATFVSHEILPPNERLKLIVKIGFQEKQRNAWVDHPGQETRTIEFTTGDAPTTIDMRNIQYSYPVIDQQYLYADESGQGYVQLQKGQSYLFQGDWEYACRFIKDDQVQKTIGFQYDEANKRLNFGLPKLSNSRGSRYQVQFSAIPKGKGSIDHSEKTEISMYNDGESSISQTAAVAMDVVAEGEERVLLEYGFSYSEHATFAAKLSRMRAGKSMSRETSSSIFSLGREISNFEGFDETELTGSRYSGDSPLVDAQAVLDDQYFIEVINPLIYDQYPINGHIRLSNEQYGIPPYKGIGIYNQSGLFPYTYDLEVIYYDHYRELQYKVINQSVRDHPLYNSYYFPLMDRGNYKIRLQYVFPDGSPGTGAEFIYKK